jgi:6-pyruvoyltetrahydropterin/6-carboxytetrahydropterin synthase
MEAEPPDSQIHRDSLMEIFKEFTFEAAHRLPNVDKDHKCAQLHGHSYRIEVHVRGAVDPVKGWVMDFADITTAFTPIRKELDHHLLNDIDGLSNPTSEHLALWIWQQLTPALPLAAIVVKETASSGSIYRGE